MSIKAHLLELIAKGKQEKVIDFLYKHQHKLDEIDRNEIIKLSSRLRMNSRKINEGLIPNEDASIEKNKITKLLIEVVNDLEEQNFKSSRRGMLYGILSGIGVITFTLFGRFNNWFTPEKNTTLPVESESPSPKIQINGTDNKIFDMSGSTQNTVNQTIYPSNTDTLESTNMDY